MKVTLGTDGLTKTWQNDFEEEVDCLHCDGKARIGFVAHEFEPDNEPHVCRLHKNHEDDSLWLHDSCAVAVYFCRKCLSTTSEYNQA